MTKRNDYSLVITLRHKDPSERLFGFKRLAVRRYAIDLVWRTILIELIRIPRANVLDLRDIL